MAGFKAGSMLNWSFIAVVQLCFSLAHFIYYRNHRLNVFCALKLIDESFFPKWVWKTLCSMVGICWGSFKA